MVLIPPFSFPFFFLSVALFHIFLLGPLEPTLVQVAQTPGNFYPCCSLASNWGHGSMGTCRKLSQRQCPAGFEAFRCFLDVRRDLTRAPCPAVPATSMASWEHFLSRPSFPGLLGSTSQDAGFIIFQPFYLRRWRCLFCGRPLGYKLTKQDLDLLYAARLSGSREASASQ